MFAVFKMMHRPLRLQSKFLSQYSVTPIFNIKQRKTSLDQVLGIVWSMNETNEMYRVQSDIQFNYKDELMHQYST